MKNKKLIAQIQVSHVILNNLQFKTADDSYITQDEIQDLSNCFLLLNEKRSVTHVTDMLDILRITENEDIFDSPNGGKERKKLTKRVKIALEKVGR